MNTRHCAVFTLSGAVSPVRRGPNQPTPGGHPERQPEGLAAYGGMGFRDVEGSAVEAGDLNAKRAAWSGPFPWC